MRKFHVSYQFNSDVGSGFGSATLTMPGRKSKLTGKAVEKFRECIDNEKPGLHSVILAITELEE